MTRKQMTTDEAMIQVVSATEDALLRIHENYPFLVEVTYAGTDPGCDGTIEFREIETDREWVITIELRHDPT